MLFLIISLSFCSYPFYCFSLKVIFYLPICSLSHTHTHLMHTSFFCNPLLCSILCCFLFSILHLFFSLFATSSLKPSLSFLILSLFFTFESFSFLPKYIFFLILSSSSFSSSFSHAKLWNPYFWFIVQTYWQNNSIQSLKTIVNPVTINLSHLLHITNANWKLADTLYVYVASLTSEKILGKIFWWDFKSVPIFCFFSRRELELTSKESNKKTSKSS